MRENPALLLFPYARRKSRPKLTPELLATIRREMKKQPPDVRLPKGSMRIRWQDRKRQWARFSPRKKLRGVLVLVEDIKTVKRREKRMGRKARLSLRRRRESSQRRSIKRWMTKAAEVFQRLTLMTQQKRQHPPSFGAPLYNWYWNLHDEREDVFDDEGWLGLLWLYDDEGARWWKRFEDRRDFAVALGGAASELLPLVKRRYDELLEALGKERVQTDWMALAPWAHQIIAQPPYNIGPAVWDDEVARVVAGSKGSQVWGRVRPMNVIRVVDGDSQTHEPGSANLLILDESIPDPELDEFRAAKYVMMVLCRFTRAQDELLDKHASFGNSPLLEERKPISYYMNSVPGRYTILPAPANYMNDPRKGEKQKTYAEMHKWLFSMTKRTVRSHKYMSYLVGARAFYIEEDANREADRLGIPRKDIKLANIESRKFTGREVWKDLFHRTWWRKGVYAIPVIFLGFVPRSPTREGRPTKPQ